MDTLNELIDACLDRSALSESTMTKYRRVFARWLAFLDDPGPAPSPAELEPAHAEAFLLSLPDLAPASYRVIYAALLGLYKYAELREVAPGISTVRLQSLVKPILAGRRGVVPDFTNREIDQVIGKAAELAAGTFKDTPGGKRARLMALRTHALIVTLAHSGMRISEALSIRVGDIRRATVPVRIKIIGKGNKERWAFLDKEADTVIRQYLEVRGEGSRSGNLYLFAGHHRHAPGGISAVTAWRDIHQVAIAALPEDRADAIHPHLFRHYFLTRVWRQTRDLLMAQSLAGHANVATTTLYTHADVEDLADGYKQTFE
jgi:site-specific recombinase XerD